MTHFPVILGIPRSPKVVRLPGWTLSFFVRREKLAGEIKFGYKKIPAINLGYEGKHWNPCTYFLIKVIPTSSLLLRMFKDIRQDSDKKWIFCWIFIIQDRNGHHNKILFYRCGRFFLGTVVKNCTVLDKSNMHIYYFWCKQFRR